MKTVAVLSGGGDKGSFQVGVLETLLGAGVKFGAMYGTSAGALNAAGMAHAGLAKLTETWLGIKGRSDILKSNLWKLPWAKGMASTTPLAALIDRVVTGPATLEAVTCSVEMGTGAIRYVSNKISSLEDFKKSVVASASIPFAMELVESVQDGKTQYWADGGVREQAPLAKAIQDGADIIYCVLCNPVTQNMEDNWTPSWPKFLSMGLRAVDVMEHESFLDDIRNCLRINEWVEKYNIDGMRHIEIHIYAPSSILVSDLDFDPIQIKDRYNLGKQAKEIVMD